MNDKILKLANILYNNEECRNNEFELTINHNEVIKKKGRYKIHEDKHGFMEFLGWDIPYLNEEGMKQIADELSKVQVENFNLTLNFEYGTNDGFDVEEGPIYKENWYHCKITFWGHNKIEIIFDMLSSLSHFSYSDFHRSVGKLKIKEDQIEDVIIKLINLKNTLVENGDRIISQLSEIKKLKK